MMKDWRIKGHTFPMADASTHILLFPFMAKGHTIPILHLSRLLLLRHQPAVAVTLLTTPANVDFIRSTSLPAAITVVTIPFPENIPGIPPGVESVDKLPHLSLMIPFVAATKLMKPHFEQTLESLHPDIVITDDFFSWTLDSAQKFNIPRYAYYALAAISVCLWFAAANGRFLLDGGGETEALKFEDYPWVEVRREDFDPTFIEPEQYHEIVFENLEASSRSHGILINTVYELESAYVDVWNSVRRPKLWFIGPMLSPSPKSDLNPIRIINWLDRMHQSGGKVLYVAFGSQVEISEDQFMEIMRGIEESGVNFVWIVRGKNVVEEGFEERVKERGMVVKGWVDQREILGHEAVQGFLSHCGWGSVMESIWAKVPILALPTMWDHPLIAKLVTEELKVGLRVETRNRAVEWRGLAEAAKELMEGEAGEAVRRKVAEVGSTVMSAGEEGGSSWRSLHEIVEKGSSRRKVV